MTLDKDPDAPGNAEPLYAWWLNLIASLAGGSVAQVPEAADAPASPFPVAQMSEALQLTRQLLGPLYQGYFQSLLAHQDPGKAFVSFQEQIHDQLKAASVALDTFARTLVSPQATLATGSWGLMKAPMEMLGQALGPVSLNLERAYGGLADAFGLASSREWQGASRQMAVSAIEKQQAQAEYLSLIVGALAKGSEGVMARLRSIGEKGETVDSLLALVRLWSHALDESMHAALQSPEALEASARLVRAASRVRQQKQRMVAIASESLNMPTRAEVDEAYREIQELKRELRRLRKSMPRAPALPMQAASVAMAVHPDRGATAAPARKAIRPAAAKRKKPLKGVTS
jgi:class III poly(R)-hydroxyalkanoic acid synthase PhaE subunit